MIREPANREPATDPHQAAERYKRIIGRSLTCLTDSIWIASPALRGPNEIRQLSLSPQPDGLPLKLRRDEGDAIYFAALQRFVVVPDDRFEKGEWKVSTREYKYTVYESTERRGTIKPVIEWHWHPDTEPPWPHVHVRADESICGLTSRKLHIPSERVAFESVVHFMIDELGVRPARDDWPQLVESARERFESFRTWPGGIPLERPAPNPASK